MNEYTRYDDGVRRTGEVVIINLWNALENQSGAGKCRPAVLIRRDGGHWVTMGLTTNPQYFNRTPRVQVPNPVAIGLRGPGWLWSDRLASVSAIDVHNRIGQVDCSMAEAIIKLANLDGRDAAALRLAACGGGMRAVALDRELPTVQAKSVAGSARINGAIPMPRMAPQDAGVPATTSSLNRTTAGLRLGGPSVPGGDLVVGSPRKPNPGSRRGRRNLIQHLTDLDGPTVSILTRLGRAS